MIRDGKVYREYKGREILLVGCPAERSKISDASCYQVGEFYFWNWKVVLRFVDLCAEGVPDYWALDIAARWDETGLAKS